jgi:hypothetical protein
MTALRRTQLHSVVAYKIETARHFCRSKALTCTLNEWGGWGSNPRPTDYESGTPRVPYRTVPHLASVCAAGGTISLRLPAPSRTAPCSPAVPPPVRRAAHAP